MHIVKLMKREVIAVSELDNVHVQQVGSLWQEKCNKSISGLHQVQDYAIELFESHLLYR